MITNALNADISLTIIHIIDLTSMKNFALYYQIKRLQCLVLPTLFFFALFIFEMIGVPEKPFNTIIAVIAILIGYYCLLQEVKDWDDWLEILMTTTFCFGIILFLYSIGMYFTQQTTIDEQINNWILTHIGKYFLEFWKAFITSLFIGGLREGIK